MGKTYGTLFRLTMGLCFLFLGLPLPGGDALNATATMKDFALPEFNKDNGQLQFILYGEKASSLGSLILLTNPKIDMVKDKVKNIRDVVSLAKARPYPLYCTLEQAQEYWRGKAHSQALIFSELAQYDKPKRMLHSNSAVFFRSRELAADGIGFDADYNRRLIHIRSHVRMVIYSGIRQYSGMRE